MWTPDPWLLLVSCVLLFGGYVLSAAMWGRIVADLGGPRIPTPRAVRIFMIANLGRYVPGKVWQIAGLAVLARREGVSGGAATAAAVAGQGVAIVAASAVGVGALLVGPDAFRAWSLPVAVALVAGVGVGLLPPVFRWVTGAWFRVAREVRPDALTSRRATGWLVLYTLNWILYAVAFWVLVLSLDLDAALVPVASSFAAAYVMGYVMIFAPAGVGVREGVLVALLTPHLGAGPSGAVAIVARLWTTVVEVGPAAAFWLRHVSTGPPSGAGREDGRG